jgi:hypothetical protein
MLINDFLIYSPSTNIFCLQAIPLQVGGCQDFNAYRYAEEMLNQNVKITGYLLTLSMRATDSFTKSLIYEQQENI